MQKLTKTVRIALKGIPQQAAVNVAQVQYVHSQGDGTYICFDTSSYERGSVTPMGVLSSESVEQVIKRLNRPYWFDLCIRVGSLLFAALGVIFAIV